MIRTSIRTRWAVPRRLRGPALSSGIALLAACGGSGGTDASPAPEARASASVAAMAGDAGAGKVGEEVESVADAPVSAAPAPPAAASSAPQAGSTVDEVVEAEPVGWVAAHQSRDGRWEVGGWNRWSMGERVAGEGLTGLGSARLDVAATALAVLAYTGAGYTMDSETHEGPVIAWALHALLYRQDPEGAFGDPQDPSWPVNHGLALWALTEACELRPEPRLVEAVRRGVGCYHRSRAAEVDRWIDDRAFGGLPPFAWIALASERARLATARGKPEGRPSATGLDGDEVLARDRARVASWIALPDPERSLAKLGAGLTIGLPEAEGGKSSPAVVAAATWLGAHAPRWDASGAGVDAIGWWLATIGIHGAGGEPWKRWEAALKTAVVDTQRKDGTPAELRGSWDPVGAGAAEGGRVVTTLAFALILEIWYRYDKVFGADEARPTAPTQVAPARAATPRAPGLPPRRYPRRR